MPKNGLFFRKNSKNRRSVGAPPPNPHWLPAELMFSYVIATLKS